MTTNENNVPDNYKSDSKKGYSAHWRFWAIILVVFALCMWLFSPVLLPFVAGAVLAYFMDPIVDKLERRSIPRWLGTVCALTLFFLGFTLLIVLLVPMIKAQVAMLLEFMPQYITKIKTEFVPFAERYMRKIDPNYASNLQDSVSGAAGQIITFIGGVFTNLLSGGVALFNVLSLLIVTPIVAFYLLRDWDQLLNSINDKLPRRHAETIRREAKKIDDTLSGFLRGQALVCLILATYYSITLTLVGLNYGVTIGIVAGVLSFVPYVGSILGFVASAGFALVQFDSMTPVFLVIGVYVLGQMLEGNVISPKIVGERVGLHAVWVIFALMAGGSLFGFLGVLVALPVAAVIGVLIRFALDQYKHSRYYRSE